MCFGSLVSRVWKQEPQLFLEVRHGGGCLCDNCSLQYPKSWHSAHHGKLSLNEKYKISLRAHKSRHTQIRRASQLDESLHWKFKTETVFTDKIVYTVECWACLPLFNRRRKKKLLNTEHRARDALTQLHGWIHNRQNADCILNLHWNKKTCDWNRTTCDCIGVAFARECCFTYTIREWKC